jgi:hypothetical protein
MDTIIQSRSKGLLASLEEAVRGFARTIHGNPQSLEVALPGHTITGWNEAADDWFCFRLLNGQALEVNPALEYSWVMTSTPRVDTWLTIPGGRLFISKVVWLPCTGKLKKLKSLRFQGHTTLTITPDRKGGWQLLIPRWS